MSTPVAPGAGVRKWVRLYNQFLFQVMALRELSAAGRNRGLLQDVLTATLRELVDATDVLQAGGWRPTARFAGAEEMLWAHAVRYAAAVPWDAPPAGLSFDDAAAYAKRAQVEWARFCGFVAGLDPAVFGTVPALDPEYLRPDRLALLVGRRGGEAPAADRLGGLPGEPADQAAVVVVQPRAAD